MAVFFAAKTFRIWLATAMVAWVCLFVGFVGLAFLLEHWFYPATMVIGAFVAGSTPEGGGAVAFPVLNIFFAIDRGHARDFSLMIQSIGMTSASLFILTSRATSLVVFRPLLWFVPVAFVGFVLGMATVQGLRVTVIQALFLALITSFAFAYGLSACRGEKVTMSIRTWNDRAITVVVLLLGGVCASLFGSGADILIYTLLVTRFHLNERLATEVSVILMAALSVLGYAYRGLMQHDLSHYQVQVWLCAYPVVLFMAPLGASVLKRVDKELLLRGVIVLNLAQLAYFLGYRPSVEKFAWGLGATAVLLVLFSWGMSALARRRAAAVGSTGDA